jgi:hypothetical protein
MILGAQTSVCDFCKSRWGGVMPPHRFRRIPMARWGVVHAGLWVLIAAFALEAQALCIYHGQLYANTTLEQEFRDSALVVRAKVSSSRDTFEDDEPGVVYGIKIDHWFKGKTPTLIKDFSERDSGGFYLDVGSEYLLFLNPISDKQAAENPTWKRVAPDATTVNYSCGQSRVWANVALKDRQKLEALSRQSR